MSPGNPGEERAVFESKPRGGRRGGSDAGPQSVGDLLMPTMARLGLKTRARHLQVMAVWAEVVGEMVAAHTNPSGLARGRLTVDTDSPAMGHQLHIQAQVIIDGINSRLGDTVVRDIRFRHQPEK